MITKQEFIDITGPDNVQEVEHFYAYAPHTFVIDSHYDTSICSAQLIFNSVTDQILFVGVYDYVNNRAYCMVAEHYDIHDENAWDEVGYTILESDEDFLEKLKAIFNQEEYDTRVAIPLNIPDDLLFTLMKIAHEKDITLNQLIDNVMVEELNRLRSIKFNTNV